MISSLMISCIILLPAMSFRRMVPIQIKIYHLGRVLVVVLSFNRFLRSVLIIQNCGGPRWKFSNRVISGLRIPCIILLLAMSSIRM